MKQSNKTVIFIDLGLKDYQEAWDYQEELLAEIISVKIKNRRVSVEPHRPTPNYLIFCQHPPVFSLGNSGNPDNLRASPGQLAEINATFIKTNRGGDITFHGPQQIVGYPILDLENFFTDIHKYLRVLEEAVIRTLQHYNITAGRIDGLTGVWIDVSGSKPRKICAIGVRTSRWVTMHGFAFNINTDLSYYDYIIPCGIEDKEVTSLEKELGAPQNVKEVEKILKKHLVDLFEMELVERGQD